MASGAGPLGFQQSGTPCSLVEALCCNGLYLTAPHIRKLIKHLGGSPPKGSNVKQLASALFGIVFGEDQAKIDKSEGALKLLEKEQIEEEMDSDFEEILDMHKDEAINTQDLKDLEKVRKKRAKALKAKAKGNDSLPIPKRKAKAKAKGKAQAKGQKRKATLGEKLLRSLKRQKLGAAETAQDVEAPAEAPQQKEAASSSAAGGTALPEANVVPPSPEKVAPESPAKPAARSKHRGPNAEATFEADTWKAAPGCSIGLSKVKDVWAWQAKLPPKVRHPVPGSRLACQNTFYAKFDMATHGKVLSKQEVKSLNKLDLESLIGLRAQVKDGSKENLGSAEARCICAKWLEDWHASQ